MRSRWIVVSFGLSLIVAVAVILILRPPRVQAQSSGYVKSGQQAVTGTAALVTGISYGTVCIKALSTNTISVFLGGSGVTDATGMELAPDDAYCMPTNNSPFFVIASTTGASVSWIVSR